jgi:putative ABC transport system ATP-binding protein
MADTILKMENIVKIYRMGDEELRALDNVDFSVDRNEFVSVLGPSGSGKSTLMNIVGCLDNPTSGTYMLNGTLVRDMSEAELAHIRNREIGFIFQQFNLLGRLTAEENVELPLIYANISAKERRERARDMLDRVGLGGKMQNYPNQLSGGQQQRVAIARAVVTEPTLLLADEPTGALDQKTGHQVMDLFHKLHAEGRTIIMITHDLNIARHGSRIVRILDGRLTDNADIEETDSSGITRSIYGPDNQEIIETQTKTETEIRNMEPTIRIAEPTKRIEEPTVRIAEPTIQIEEPDRPVMRPVEPVSQDKKAEQRFTETTDQTKADRPEDAE